MSYLELLDKVARYLDDHNEETKEPSSNTIERFSNIYTGTSDSESQIRIDHYLSSTRSFLSEHSPQDEEDSHNHKKLKSFHSSVSMITDTSSSLQLKASNSYHENMVLQKKLSDQSQKLIEESMLLLELLDTYSDELLESDESDDEENYDDEELLQTRDCVSIISDLSND